MPSIFDYFTNSSFFNGISLYLNTLEIFLSESVQILSKPDQLTAGVLDFDDFQLKLLKVFSCILSLNLLLVYISWKYYGDDIYERFIKPTNKSEIEELKASVAKLKLPKEYTPRN